MVDKNKQGDDVEYEFEEQAEEAPVVTTARPSGSFMEWSVRKKLLVGLMLVLVVFAAIHILNRAPQRTPGPEQNTAGAEQAAAKTKAMQAAALTDAQNVEAQKDRADRLTRLQALEAQATQSQAAIAQLTQTNGNLTAQVSDLQSSVSTLQSTLNKIQSSLSNMESAQQEKADALNPNIALASVQAMTPTGDQAWLVIPGRGVLALRDHDFINDTLGEVTKIDPAHGTVTTTTKDGTSYVLNYGINYGQSPPKDNLPTTKQVS